MQGAGALPLSRSVSLEHARLVHIRLAVPEVGRFSPLCNSDLDFSLDTLTTVEEAIIGVL